MAATAASFAMFEQGGNRAGHAHEGEMVLASEYRKFRDAEQRAASVGAPGGPGGRGGDGGAAGHVFNFHYHARNQEGKQTEGIFQGSVRELRHAAYCDDATNALSPGWAGEVTGESRGNAERTASNFSFFDSNFRS